MIHINHADFASFLESSINQGQNIRFILDSLYTESENRLEMVVKKILQHYNREDLVATVYTCIKELVINGMKANAKRIFFDNSGLNLHNESDYQKGIVGFREIIQSGQLESYMEQAKKSGLHVEIDFQHDNERLLIHVINYVELTEAERHLIENKLSQALKYDDIAQFYMDTANAEDEGSGMGLTMIILMLKGHDLSAERFQIKTQDDKRTIASLDFPLV